MGITSTSALLLLVTIGAFLLLLFVRALREMLALRRVRGTGEREYDMASIARYFDASEAARTSIPARAWADLDMDDVYRIIDRTVSVPGRHLLYARLRREDHDAASLRGFDDAVTRVGSDGTLATCLRVALEPLAAPATAALPALFQAPPPRLPRASRALPLMSAVGVACMVGVFWWHALILGIAAVILLNAYVRVALRDRIDAVVPGMRMLPSLVRAASRLARLEVPELGAHLDTLRELAPRLQWLTRAARWLAFEPTGGNEIAGYVYEYINMIFLLDVISCAWSVEAIRAERSTLRRVYEALGELDVLQAIAALRAEPRFWSRPVFLAGTERKLAFDSLSHPLIGEPVASSLELSGCSMLLTGSNMSGKSTFIRAVGVSAILARTIHTVFAERWHAPLLAVRTSIGRADSLLQGTSYYRAEVDAVGALLEPAPATRRLILIDELFRGTNSVERIAAAKAVLVGLDGGDDLVIVATHDLELIPMLPSYARFHFREEIRDGALTFDYRLHHGPSSTRNALAILALAGYPADVVDDATRTAVLVERRMVTGNE